MPKAFTHLCGKVNLSLFDDTLTIYLKKEIFYSIVDGALDILDDRGDIKRFIHGQNKGHDLYHQDDFNRNSTHFHAQFKTTIDDAKFSTVLRVFLKRSVISAEEFERCLESYKNANTLPKQFQPLHAKSKDGFFTFEEGKENNKAHANRKITVKGHNVCEQNCNPRLF